MHIFSRAGAGVLAVAVVVAVSGSAGALSDSHLNRATQNVVRHEASLGSLSRLDGGVAFIIGASTDPENGNSRPRGFGVARDLLGGHPQVVKARLPWGPSGITWLTPDKLVLSGLRRRRSAGAIYTERDGRFMSLQALPLGRQEWEFAVSPDEAWVAAVPYVSCGQRCIRPGRSIFVERPDGRDRRLVARGVLHGWTPDGRLLVFRGSNTSFATGTYVAVNTHSKRSTRLISSYRVAAFAHVHYAALDDLAFSHDGRYVAARVALSGKSAIVIARVNGGITDWITSKVIISMLAWSPRTDELAYSTSGFPSPHELFVVSSPAARPRRILSQRPHFDWLTWAPNGRWILIDNEHLGEWEVLHLVGHRHVAQLGGAAVPTTRLPRLGGMPTWCCSYANSAGE